MMIQRLPRFRSPIAAWLWLLVCLFAAAPASTLADRQFQGQRLYLLNWSDYLDPEVASDFEQYYGVELVHTYYETDEHRDRLLAENGIRGYDLAIVDGAKLDLYRKRGWLQPFDLARMPAVRDPIQRCRPETRASESYTVAYFWGTEGIVYREDLVDGPLERWMQLFRPAESLRGKIVMIDDAREVLGMAVRALGYSPSAADRAVWVRAARLAEAQRPFLQSYGTLALDRTSAILSGDVVAAQIYNGEAVALRKLDDRIRYVHPQEGSSMWVDHWVLLADAPHPELAHAFLDFINEPRRAADNAQSLYFATCNTEAKRFLPEAFLADPIIYPPKSVMQNLEPDRRLSPDVLPIVNMEFSRIKQRD